MKSELFETFRIIFPELRNYEEPGDLSDLEELYDWLNTEVSNIQQIDIANYRDNGIDECDQLNNRHHVDIEALKSKIELDIRSYYQRYKEGDEEQDLDHMYSNDEQFTLDAILKNLKDVAENYNLTLFVIYAEDPYWLLVPTDNELNEQLLTVFNDIYEDEAPMAVI
ncbi:hypothetical protein [Acinetobacter stercoris]|uniref:Uncharacterized protein n=1 Tax=Acinetobacter stercoris TaxID=2126983 RepID=A0A2U3MUD9_9GAMM|nr:MULTISPECIES: hypothetical protein [Acinetobacter]SPL69032.1 hypothetical protein KPC_0210 [Acinetobacter stercoris]